MSLSEGRIQKMSEEITKRLKWLKDQAKGNKKALSEYQECNFCYWAGDDQNSCNRCPADGGGLKGISGCTDPDMPLCRSRRKLNWGTGTGTAEAAQAHYNNLKPLCDKWRRKYVWGKKK